MLLRAVCDLIIFALGLWLGFQLGFGMTRKAVERALRHGRLQIGRTEYFVRWQVTGPRTGQQFSTPQRNHQS